MTAITAILADELKNELSNADEIWVAVGLLNAKGLQFVLEILPPTCKLNFIVGIDLPTDPKALSKLLSLNGRREINAKILTNKFFHPKVYIIRVLGKLTAFVGSANCTSGGFENNIEMSIRTKDGKVCKQLIGWYESTLLPNSQALTTHFLNDYKPKYDKRIKRIKKENKEIRELKAQELIKLRANIKSRRKFISALKRFRRSKRYLQVKRERQIAVRRLKKSLDYPNFKNLDLKKFFAIKDLGTIDRRMTQTKILENPRRFTQLMKFLCNENIPIKARIDGALKGSLSIKNIAKGFISKVLVIHDSKKYYLHNNAFTGSLRPFGLVLPRGRSFGAKYELIRDTLKEIIIETDIDNFAILDEGLFDM